MATKTIRRGTVTRKRKSRLPWLVWLFVILAVVAWWALYQSRWFLVEHIKVNGASRVPVATVTSLANVHVGKPLMSVNPSGIVQKLKDVPQIKDAKVERGWPHTVLITVIERSPVAVMATSKGFVLIDDEGMVAGTSPTKPKNLKVVVAKPNTSAMKAAAQVITGLPAKWKVSYVAAPSAESVTVVLTTGQKIFFGSGKDVAMKVKVAKALLANKFKTINVSAPMNPTVK